jgi:hypothetical protein
VVVGEAEEDAVGEVGDLDDEQREVVAVVVDGAVEGEEGLDEERNIGVGRDDVGHGDAVGDGVDDVDALSVTVDGYQAAEDVAVGVAVLVGGEAAGDGVVGVERLSERGLEVVEEAGRGKGGLA